MKIALISGSNVIHTTRWANSLAARGHEVHLYDCHDTATGLSELVFLHKLKYTAPIGYFLNSMELRKCLAILRPDIVNVHYASGYGTLARLSKLHLNYPYLLSLWGSDIYDFPNNSLFHKMILKKNLRAATSIASTSNCMAIQANKIMESSYLNCEITPFGVDAQRFQYSEKDLSSKQTIVIGTVKRLMYKYGVDTLIEAFSLLIKKDCLRNYKLILVGEGPQETELRNLVAKLNLESHVEFRGACTHDQVPNVLKELDIFVALSRLDSESFGVAIVESAFAGVPVVVTDSDGPKEVVGTLENGFIVPKENPQMACDMLYELVTNPDVYRSFSISGRELGLKHYEWESCVSKMLDVYTKTINSFKSIKE